MRGAISLLLLTSLAFSAKAAYADADELKTMLVRNNCTACHMVDKRKYGPNMVEIAQKYAGDSGAVDKLAAKIKAGGSGVWGEDMMPPQAQVKDADARTIAQMILSLKPAADK